MKTGEGKTFVASLALYLNALAGQGRPPRHRQRLPRPARRRVEPRRLRAARDDGRVHREQHAVRSCARLPTRPTSPTARTPSSASTTCATTWRSPSTHVVQRGHHYAIVDEVDSILIDEARTPLIISGEPTTAAKTYYDFARIVKRPRRRPVEGHEARGRAPRTGVRLPLRREAQDGLADRVRDREGRARAARREPLQPGERPARQPPHPGAEGGGALQARRRLRRPGRRGEDRRRVHRPHHGGPPLERRASTRRSRRRRASRSRRSTRRSPRSRCRTTSASRREGGRQARRHDRHREDRGEGVRRDLRPRASSRSRPTSRSPATTRTT